MNLEGEGRWGSCESDPTEWRDCPLRKALDPGPEPDDPVEAPLTTLLGCYSPCIFSVWPRLGDADGRGKAGPAVRSSQCGLKAR